MKRLLLCLFFPVALSAAPLSEKDAAAYIDQLAASRPKNSIVIVHFRETKTSPLLTQPAISEGDIAFQPPSRFRRETTGAKGSLMVSNGEVLWIYYPGAKEAERYDLQSKAGDAFQGLMSAFNMQDLAQLFKFSVDRADDVNRITLVPKRSSERRMFGQMVLEVGPDLKLRIARWKSPGGGQTEMSFSGETTAKTVNFDFKPPAGVRVTNPLGR